MVLTWSRETRESYRSWSGEKVSTVVIFRVRFTLKPQSLFPENCHHSLLQHDQPAYLVKHQHTISSKKQKQKQTQSVHLSESGSPKEPRR